MLEKEILSKIVETKEYLHQDREFGKFDPNGLGFYSYDDEIINMISAVTEKEEYRDIYISNMKEIFQKGDISNLNFEECITYFHWLWTAERMAVGTINRQIKTGRFESMLNLLEKHLNSDSY